MKFLIQRPNLDPAKQRLYRIKKAYLSELAALPLALLAASLCQLYLPTISFLTWLSYMIFHQMGHALIGNLSGKLSLPTLYYTTSIGTEKNFILISVLALALTFIIKESYRNNMLALAGSCSLLLTLQFALTFILPKPLVASIVIYSGLGAELIGSATLLLLFYANMPSVLKWQITRYPLLIISSLTFCDAVKLWLYTVPKTLSELAGETVLDFDFIFGQDESGKDIKKLIKNYLWSEEQIIFIYQLTTWLSIILLLAIWSYITYRRIKFAKEL